MNIRTRGRIFTCLLAGVAGACPATLSAQDDDPVPRLYVLDCGRLTGRNLQTYGFPDEPRDLAVPCFLIVHARGTLLWETGLGDRFANGNEPPRDPGWRVTAALESQLAEIGVTPSGVTFLAISHSHADHMGNADLFAGSTWLVQEAEREWAFAEGRNTDSYGELAGSRTIRLDGDHDVFGDGAVILKSTPGHTPGHQSLLVRLPQTGPLLLSGDLYHYPEQRGLDRFADFEYDEEQSAASRAAVEDLLAETGATLWIGHDIQVIDRLTTSPSYYR
jgi:glyoxylase-like metal-dependent hydrolase (beta-lactamase superfamily II)